MKNEVTCIKENSGEIKTYSEFLKMLSKNKANINLKIKTISTKICKSFVNFVKWGSRLFKSAIVFWGLGYFAPEIRTELPSLYRLVDLLMDVIEMIYNWFWMIIGG